MIGIIGGTGLYSMGGVKILQKKTITTPFGKPSAPVVLGKFGSQKVAFLPRHGLQHTILPSEINYRANIWALKSVGVKRIVSISATGSLVEEINPGSIVLANKYFDWTKGKREASFFGKGLVAHVSTAEPVCPALTREIERAATKAGVKLHTEKTYACIEGPRFGTRAESFFLKGAGCHLVGMTNVPEAFLAREAQLCYCTIAVATDYDCWMDDPAQHCSTDKILELYKRSLSQVTQTLAALLEQAPESSKCRCGQSLEGALLTHAKALRPTHKKIWAFLKK